MEKKIPWIIGHNVKSTSAWKNNIRINGGRGEPEGLGHFFKIIFVKIYFLVLEKSGKDSLEAEAKRSPLKPWRPAMFVKVSKNKIKVVEYLV